MSRAQKRRGVRRPRAGAAASNPRALAATVLAAVHAGQNVEAALAARAANHPERALVFELCYGTLRHHFTLTGTVAARLSKPLRDKDQDIHCLLLVGAYQKYFTRIPEYASIDQSVAAAEVLGKPWAKGLLNAVLRRLPAAPVAATELPAWLIEALERAYPADFPNLRDHATSRAPMALRVNRRRIDPDRYRAKLEQTFADRGTAAGSLRSGALPETIVLGEAMAVAELPGYEAGEVAVQDEGAQLAAAVLAPAVGSRVLDACAAPGGKAFHLVERTPDAHVTALELRTERLAVLRAEATRLGHDRGLEIRQGDATTLEWWDGTPYDAVLVDAPCTGTGTLRRHPDIKLHRTAADVPRLAELQRAILANVWRTLRPGGTLLYCTCSVLPEENEEVVSAFLRQFDAEPQPIEAGWGQRRGAGRQLLPTPGGPDGFYFALLRRPAEGASTHGASR